MATDIAIAGRVIPLAAVIATGSGAAGTTVEFGLDPAAGPVELTFGDLIGFIEDEVSAGDLRSSMTGADTLAATVPSVGGNLTSGNTTKIVLRQLRLKVAPTETAFAIGIDVSGATPTDPAIGLPGAIAEWLSITRVGVGFRMSVTRPAA